MAASEPLSEVSKPNRAAAWQFRLGTLFCVVTLLAIPLFTSRLSTQDPVEVIQYFVFFTMSLVIIALVLHFANREGQGYGKRITARRVSELADTLGYPVDAIMFIWATISAAGGAHTSQIFELMRRNAEPQFGIQAKETFRSWGILRSEDVGSILDGLIRKRLIIRSDDDSWKDFDGTFDLERLFPNQDFRR